MNEFLEVIWYTFKFHMEQVNLKVKYIKLRLCFVV